MDALDREVLLALQGTAHVQPRARAQARPLAVRHARPRAASGAQRRHPGLPRRHRPVGARHHRARPGRRPPARAQREGDPGVRAVHQGRARRSVLLSRHRAVRHDGGARPARPRSPRAAHPRGHRPHSRGDRISRRCSSSRSPWRTRVWPALDGPAPTKSSRARCAAICTTGGTTMAKKGLFDLHEMKRAGEAIAWLTAYDYPTAQFEEAAGVDMILVGDSLGMCVYGYAGTVPVTMDQCIVHAEAVRRGAQHLRRRRHALGQLPPSRRGRAQRHPLSQRADVDAIKLEGGVRTASRVRAILDAGVPCAAISASRHRARTARRSQGAGSHARERQAGGGGRRALLRGGRPAPARRGGAA